MPIPAIETHNLVNERSTVDFESQKKAPLVEISTPGTEISSSSEYSITSSSASSSDSVSSDELSLQQGLEVKGEETLTRSVVVTEHRKLELEGKLLPEPLLVENSGRFVLFPIQNPEVCSFKIIVERTSRRKLF